MSDKIKSNEWNSYEYDIKVTVNHDGKMTELKPAQIQNLMIEKDFDGTNMPIMLLELSLQSSSNITINNNTEFIIEIDKFIASKDKTGKIIKKKNKSTYIRDTFSAITTDTTADNNSLTDISNKENKVKKGQVTQSDLTSKTSFTLYRKKDLSASKHISNYVLKKVTMTETITLLLSEAGCSKVLMTNLDNTSKIDELLLMPVGMIQQLNYLKNYYGWHKEDTMIFMDYDRMYLIRMNGKCTVWEPSELKQITFYVSAVANGDEQAEGMVKKGNSMYVNVGSNGYTGADTGSVSEQTTGTNVMLVNENAASISTVKGSTSNTLSSSGSTNIKTTTGHNAYLNNWVKCRNTESSGIMNIVCTNIDISQITPNKEYHMASGSTKVAKSVNATYRVSKISSAFAKDGNSFSCKSNITLKKSNG